MARDVRRAHQPQGFLIFQFLRACVYVYTEIYNDHAVFTSNLFGTCNNKLDMNLERLNAIGPNQYGLLWEGYTDEPTATLNVFEVFRAFRQQIETQLRQDSADEGSATTSSLVVGRHS